MKAVCYFGGLSMQAFNEYLKMPVTLRVMFPPTPYSLREYLYIESECPEDMFWFIDMYMGRISGVFVDDFDIDKFNKKAESLLLRWDTGIAMIDCRDFMPQYSMFGGKFAESYLAD